MNLKKGLTSLWMLLIPMAVSAAGQPPIQQVSFNSYTPILALAVIGFTSTRLIKRNKTDGENS